MTTTENNAAERNTRAKSAVSLSTIDNILSSARQVLIEHGYASFTTRRVAEAAGISPGNLSYHFPSKNELIQALISNMLDQYLCNFENEIKKSDQSLTIGLDKLVEWLMVDAISEATVRTFRELWAMALHDESIRKMVDDFYDITMERATILIAQNQPTLDIEKLRESVHLLAMIAEGGIVLYGSRQNRAVSFTRIKQLVHALSESDLLGMA
jgi:AcrR family transcriptional regulator